MAPPTKSRVDKTFGKSLHSIVHTRSIDQKGARAVELLHAVVPPSVDVLKVLEAFFPLNDAVNYDGHQLPLFTVQVTELADGVFVGFVCNHALADGTAFWGFLNALAEITRARLAPPEGPASRQRPLFQRWSPDGGMAPALVVLPCADPSELIQRPARTPLRGRVLHFLAESLAALKEQARQELLAARDAAGAAALTLFQGLGLLMWRCVTRAWRLAADHETAFRVAVNNRGRLRPALPGEYFGNCIHAVSTEPVRSSDLLAHGQAAAALGRAVAAHTDAAIWERVAAWTTSPPGNSASGWRGRGAWVQWSGSRCEREKFESSGHRESLAEFSWFDLNRVEFSL